MNHDPLLSFPPGCRIGTLIGREKRFFIRFSLDGRECLAHTNNSGSMLGLLRPGSPILVSPAPLSAGRKLPFTLEVIWLEQTGPARTLPAAGVLRERPLLCAQKDGTAPFSGPGLVENGRIPLFRDCFPVAMPEAEPVTREPCTRQVQSAPPQLVPPLLPPGLAVGVNTLTPNRLLRAAFNAGRLPWAEGYTCFKAEARRGASRLDALLTGPGKPPLWVECKNVTLVEDGVAAFPDAVTARGLKHLAEMVDIIRAGERAAFFYCVQRPDARCFGPADYVDAAYADLYYTSLALGVEAHPHLAPIRAAGIDLGPELPLAPRPEEA